MDIPTPYENYLNNEERNIEDYGPHVEEVMGLISDGAEAEVIESELRKNVDYYRLTISEAKRRTVRLHGGSVESVVGNITYLVDIDGSKDKYSVKGKIVSTQFANRGTNDDGSPKTVTEAFIEDATGKKKVIIWSQVELTVNNEYTIKRCSYNDRYNNLSVNNANDIIDMGVAKEESKPIVRKIENTVKISDIGSANGKWIKATVVNYSEALSSNGNYYKRVTLRDDTGIETFYDWGNNDYTVNETITAKVEVRVKNGRTFLNISTDSKIIRG